MIFVSKSRWHNILNSICDIEIGSNRGLFAQIMLKNHVYVTVMEQN